MKAELLAALLAARAEKKPVVVATRLADGEQRLIGAGEGSDGEAELIRTVLRTDKCHTTDGDAPVFYQPFNPPLRMAVVGAVHIAQPLCTMAALAGYEVTVIDPREAFAAPERFPGVVLDTDWPDEALQALAPDSRTAVVTLTHDPKLDDPALNVALKSDAFYVGSLGSRKTHASRVRRLEKAGFDEEAIARVRAPVGLAIGARSPAEIAVSVMAQVTETLRTES
ncbi:MAG: XdhC family protein [Myxococcota bacterium]